MGAAGRRHEGPFGPGRRRPVRRYTRIKMHLAGPFLLHVAPAASRVTTSVDLPVVALAAAFFGFALTALVPAPAPRLWSAGRRLLRRVAPIVVGGAVALAVLPTVVPYDHLFPVAHAASTAADEAEHEAHCHGAPASCADAPVTVGPGQLMAAQPIVVAPAMFAVLVVLTLPALIGRIPRPLLRPPCVAAFA